ncbi:hypothetical protein ABZP36_010808 [Zizania latifolia]
MASREGGKTRDNNDQRKTQGRKGEVLLVTSDPLPFASASASASGGPAPPHSDADRQHAETSNESYNCFCCCDQGDDHHHQAPIITSTAAAPTACARGTEEKVEVAKDW